MQTIEQLRGQLTQLFDEIKSGAVDVKVASEMNNTAGKIIGSLKVQLEYAALRKESPSIKFMDQDPT